jgi:hypothetical protein
MNRLGILGIVLLLVLSVNPVSTETVTMTLPKDHVDIYPVQGGSSTTIHCPECPECPEQDVEKGDYLGVWYLEGEFRGQGGTFRMWSEHLPDFSPLILVYFYPAEDFINQGYYWEHRMYLKQFDHFLDLKEFLNKQDRHAFTVLGLWGQSGEVEYTVKSKIETEYYWQIEKKERK